MCKPIPNKNKYILKKGTQRLIKAKGNKHCMSQTRKSTNTEKQSNTCSCTHARTHTESQWDRTSSRGLLLSPSGTGSWAAWEQSQMRWAWPTHLCVCAWVCVWWGCFSIWNTEGLAAVTSFNLICIRAIFGANIVFHCRGIAQGHRKQQQTVDPRGEEQQRIPTPNTHTQPLTISMKLSLPLKHILDPASTFPQLDFLNWNLQSFCSATTNYM